MKTPPKKPAVRKPAPPIPAVQEAIDNAWGDCGNAGSMQSLSEAEYTEMEQLIDDASYSNREVFDAARKVGRLRSDLGVAEARLAAVRARNGEIHRKLAPLFHRLPV